MYLAEGYVCGGEPQGSIEVTSVKPLDDMMLLVTFNNGEVRIFDANELKGPAFEPLRDKDIFDNPVVEYGVVTWDDGQIDIAPEYMYAHSYAYLPSEQEALLPV